MIRNMGGSTALQKMLGDYSTIKRSAVKNTQHTPLSGIGMWNKMGEESLQSGLTDAMTGNLEMETSNQLGTKFGNKMSNPWEAFLATPAEQQEQNKSDQNSLMSAYKPQARGINMSIW